MEMTKSQKKILGALLLHGRGTIHGVYHFTHRNKSTVRKTLKLFYDMGICDRDKEDGILEYKLSREWINNLWFATFNL